MLIHRSGHSPANSSARRITSSVREQFLEEGELSGLDEAADRRRVADRDHPEDSVRKSRSRSSGVCPAGICRSPRRRSNARRDHPARRHALATGRRPSATRCTASSLRNSLSTLRGGSLRVARTSSGTVTEIGTAQRYAVPARRTRRRDRAVTLYSRRGFAPHRGPRMSTVSGIVRRSLSRRLRASHPRLR